MRVNEVPFIQSLVFNVGVIAPCCIPVFFLGWWARAKGRSSWVYQALAAVVFALMIASLIGFTAITPTGAAIDARGAPALLAGMVGGPLAALATAMMGGALRFWVGGPFVLSGVTSVMVFCAMGLFFPLALDGSLQKWARRLFLASAVVTFVALPSLFIGVPVELGFATFKAVVPLLFAIDISATLALGLAYWAGIAVADGRRKVSLLQSALASTGNGILITDASPDTNIVFSNEGVSRITGYSQDELIGRSPRLFHEGLEDQPGLKELGRAIRTRRPIRVELVNRRKDGREFINYLSVSPIAGDDGVVEHFVGVQDDITALRETEHFVHMVAERLPLSLALFDLDERILLVNDQFRCWHNSAPGEAEGRTLSDVVGAEEYERLQDAVANARRGETIVRERSWDSPLNGRQVTVRETFIPARTAKNALVSGCIWVVEDISEQRSTEEELRQSHKMRSIGDLTGGIAHDFNNLNAVVIGNLELLGETIEEKDGGPFLTEALNAAYRAADLTKSMLSFARRAPLQPRVFSAPDQFEALEPLLRASLPETIGLTLDIADEVGSLRLDPGSLDNAILNLVLNARDAIGPNAGEVRVEARVDILDQDSANDPGKWFAGDLSDLPPGRYLSFSVSDTGAGVAPEIRLTMFEPFATTKGVEIGNGLGLSMVHGFVHQSGGWMRVGDRSGGGTIVKLWFPEGALVQEYQAEDKTPSETIRVSGRLKAIIVEDESAVRRILARRLEGLGFQVIDFSSADKALASIERTGPPDLLLSDVVLAGNVQGPDLARHVKLIWPSVKVALASGYPAVDLTDRASETHDVFLQKPFTQSDLVAAIRTCMPDARLVTSEPASDDATSAWPEEPARDQAG